jgi:nicotinamide-nucleotide amidase
MNLVEKLTERGLWICTAESLTAGAIAAEIAKYPGASKVLLGSIVAYQDQVKTKLLSVNSKLIQQQTAVSAEVAAQMAVGVRERFAEAASVAVKDVIGISSTGVAGPDSVGEHKPGEVYLGLSFSEEVLVFGEQFEGDRAAVIAATVAKAIAVLSEEIG